MVENSLQTFPMSGMCACMHMHDGHADSPPSCIFFPSSSSSSSSSLAVACLTRGFELHCLLSGLCLDLTLILEPIAVEDLRSLGAAESRNTQQFTATQLCRLKVSSVSRSLSNQPPALLLQLLLGAVVASFFFFPKCTTGSLFLF